VSVELSREGLSAVLQGGPYLTIASLRAGTRELLVASEALPQAYCVHGQRAGITLLHPWANRLGADAFPVAERAVRVEPGDPLAARDPAGLPIHGLAHPSGWAVERLDASCARGLAQWPELPAFPFAHTVEVEVKLEAGSRLRISTTLRAAGAAPVPVAFGWHPYFAAAAEPVLSFPARRALALDAGGLPTGGVTDQAPAAGIRPQHALDDAFEEIAEGATWELQTGPARLAVQHHHGFPCAQVFVPRDAPVVSYEPMTAPVDALRTGRGLRLAQPGSSYSASFTVALAG
jgi:aldose 1-epimerase